MKIPTVDWSKIDWQPVRPGIDRKAFSGDGATVALHRSKPGHEPRPHAHPYEQIVWIIEGKVDFHVGADSVRLGPGGLLTVPPNVTHYAEVVGDEVVLNLDIFTPRRPEYA